MVWGVGCTCYGATVSLTSDSWAIVLKCVELNDKLFGGPFFPDPCFFPDDRTALSPGQAKWH